MRLSIVPLLLKVMGTGTKGEGTTGVGEIDISHAFATGGVATACVKVSVSGWRLPRLSYTCTCVE